MNIRLLSILLVLISWKSLHSQNDTNQFWGLNISSSLHTTLTEYYYKNNQQSAGYYLDFAQERYLMTLSVSYTVGKHTMTLGPRIYLPEKFYKKIGAQLTYDYSINKTIKRFNPILLVDLIYSYENFTNERILTIGTTYNSKHKIVSNYLHLMFSFGLKTYLTHNLYLDLGAGIGIGLQSHTSTDKVAELPDFNDLNSKTGLFDKPELNNMVKIGIGYYFK
ncbi:MAG TPA: hypothetical protein PKW37_05505 [Salinivirgaceae bacterium]|nr:hypothetical protein [Salinivirgaceae bacterium]